MKPFDDMFDFTHDGELDPLEKGAEMAFLSECFFDDDSGDDLDCDSESDNDE